MADIQCFWEGGKSLYGGGGGVGGGLDNQLETMLYCYIILPL